MLHFLQVESGRRKFNLEGVDALLRETSHAACAAAGSPSGNNHMGARAERAAAGIVTKQKTAPLPAPFWCTYAWNRPHFDWR